MWRVTIWDDSDCCLTCGWHLGHDDDCKWYGQS